MNQTVDVTTTIIETINTILQNLFSSIDNNLYNILDDITFINSNIINDPYFEKILGTSTSNGILLITNSLLFGFLLFYSIKYLFSHLTLTPIESPYQFIFKVIFFGLCINYSYFIISKVLDFFSLISLSIRGIGEELFNKNICFSELISDINNSSLFPDNSFDFFSLDGIIKSTITIALLNLIFSYSFRFVMVKVFILLTPFSILSLLLKNTSWFFQTWARNLFSLFFIFFIVSIVLLLLFSMYYFSGNLLAKFIYVGALYALIKSNSFVREFIGGVSTTFSQSVGNFLKK